MHKRSRKISGRTPNRVRNLLPVRHFGKMEKIRGTIELQKICQTFSIPFEPIKVYGRNSKFLLSDIEGADRILFRTESNRMERVVKGAPERLNRIAEHIKHAISISGKSKFIVQKVGLRRNIERFGTININSKMIQYFEERHNAAYEKIQPAFLLGGIWGGTPQFEFKGNELNLGAGKLINKKLGNRNASEMLKYLQNRIGRDYTARLRFVKYRGKKQCFFYDMTTH